MSSRTLRRLVLALTPAAALATVAFAQPAGPPPGPHAPHGPPTTEMKSRHEAMQKQHLEDLKTVLRLRPDQEAALTAFVAAHHGAERKERPMRDGAPQTTPERLDEMAKHQAAMAAEREKHRQALAKFYAALSPDQQKVFDALHRLNAHGPMGGHGGPRRMMIRRGGPAGHGGHGAMVRHEPPR